MLNDFLLDLVSWIAEFKILLAYRYFIFFPDQKMVENIALVKENDLSPVTLR